MIRTAASEETLAEFERFLAGHVYLQQAEQSDPGEVWRGELQGEVRALSNIVLSATSEADLISALDEAFTSPAFARYLTLLDDPRSAAVVHHAPITAPLETMRARERLFGLQVAQRLWFADSLWHHAAVRARAGGQSTKTHATTPDPVAATMDASIPLELREDVLAAWRGMLALNATRSLVERGVSHPLVAAMAEHGVQGARAVRRMIRGTRAAEAVRRHARREAWVSEAVRKASEGDGFFSPFGSSR